MEIGQLSKRTGVSVRSIRHYEKKGLITATRLENGYRDFDESAIDRIKIIQIYLGLGLTTDQIRGVLNCHDNFVYPDYEYLCEETLEVYEERLNEVNRNIDTLNTVKKRLEKQINQIKKSDS
ncbi:MerR family transcriptional regulator [Shimazuella kribbensis]|uniref:MerR family transcriptional regulator n=1 Tax=Shimazuella kribbensis TaxID=139808 RepID=UPI00040C2A26|nr:MerR family transcriptional regulator [Shimazuella kribbensis]